MHDYLNPWTKDDLEALDAALLLLEDPGDAAAAAERLAALCEKPDQFVDADSVIGQVSETEMDLLIQVVHSAYFVVGLLEHRVERAREGVDGWRIDAHRALTRVRANVTSRG